MELVLRHLTAVYVLCPICLQAMLGPSPQVLSELLNSTWAGWESQPAGASKEATAACFEDLLVWGLTKVRQPMPQAMPLANELQVQLSICCCQVMQRATPTATRHLFLMPVLGCMMFGVLAQHNHCACSTTLC